jgi:hypothetical protein
MLRIMRNVDILAELGRKCLALAASLRAADLISLVYLDRCRPVPRVCKRLGLAHTGAQALNVQPINNTCGT